jgi:hypothetical protein
MDMELRPFRTGVALGSAVGLFHAGWAALVAFGWAQPVIDFIFWLHFIKLPIELQPFSLPVAAGLVVVTFSLSFLMGAVFAAIWNRLHREPAAVGRTARA